jgi:parvulin-like peptidyl-prolyl isomerase
MLAAIGVYTLWSAVGAPGTSCAGPASPSGSATLETMAATVDGEAISVGAVARSLQSVLDGRRPNPRAKALLEAQTLEQLIQRTLVRRYLEQQGWGASQEAIDAKLEPSGKKPVSQPRSREAPSARASLADRARRQQIAWQLSWKPYVAKHLTDSVLEACFAAHRREFDGTAVRASHILLRPERSDDPRTTVALVAKANFVRRQLVSGATDFAEAARRYSAAPSRTRGGDLGYFPRHGVMAEAFSRAAFALDVGETSGPVVTRFGVHLIHLTEIKPGTKRWTDVREQLLPLAERELFDELAQAEREKAEIEYSGAVPYFKSGTRDVVLPNQAVGPEAK